MKQIVICVVFLLVTCLAWSQAMWLEDSVVREGQDLHGYGKPIRDASGNVLSTWVKSSGDKHGLYAALRQPDGTPLWDNPLLIIECNAPIKDIYLLFTTDNSFIISWLESNSNLGQQVMMQKISSSGVPLWGSGVNIVSDRYQTSYSYKTAANSIGGAYVFYHEDGENQLFGRCYNASGTETWGADAPEIITPNGLLLSEVASVTEYGVAVQYKCNSNSTNYVERYADYGYRNWQQAYPFEPGEGADSHRIFVTADHKIFDVAKRIDDNQSLIIRVWGSDGTQLITPYELVLAETAATNLKYDICLDGQSLQVLFQKTVGAQNELRYYNVSSMVNQVYPPGGLLLGTHNGSVRNLKISTDNTMKVYCAWLEENSNAEVLKVNMVNNDLQAAWGANGISLCSNPNGIGNYSIVASNTMLSAQFETTDNTHKKLNQQVVNANGTLVFAAGGQTLTSALVGSAMHVATHKLGDRVLILYRNINAIGQTGLFYQIISSAGYPILAQPHQLGSYATPTNYVSSCEIDNNRVAVVFKQDAYYFQILHYNGDHGLLEPGVHITSTITDGFELSFYNGDIYFGWMENSSAGYKKLMGQRFSNWQMQWGNEGKVLVDNIPALRSYITASKGLYFTWIGRSGAETANSIQCLLVDTNGDPAPGWNASGEVVFSTPNDDDNRPFYAQLQGTDIIFVLGGYAPSSILAVKVTAQGDIPWGLSGLQLADNSVTYLGCKSREDGFGILMSENVDNSIKLVYQRVDTNGNLAFANSGRIIHTVPSQEFLRSVTLAEYTNGGAVAIWEQASDTESDKLLYSTINTSGLPVESSAQLISSKPGFQMHPASVSMENEAIVVWRSDNNYGLEDFQESFGGLLAQKLNGMIASNPEEPQLVEGVLFIKSLYPNPFSESFTLNWQQKNDNPVVISIYNLKGQLVASLPSYYKAQGEYSTNWNGADSSGKKVGKGIYFVKVQSGKSILIKRVVKL